MHRLFLLIACLFFSSSVSAETSHRGAYAEINGMEMYYEVIGSGDPIIVLHGAYMNIPAMGDIIPMLSRSRMVYAVELQGHGRTENIDRPITYQAMADDVAKLMDRLNLSRADVFGYSMGAAIGLHLAARHPEKVDQLVAASLAYDLKGMQPDYLALVPAMSVEMFLGTPIEADWKALSPDPDRFHGFVEQMIALEHEPVEWEAEVKGLRSPVLLISGDADVSTLQHQVALFRLLGGGAMGDMGQPLPASRHAILPATSHTAIIRQPDVLFTFIDQFLKGDAPKGMFDQK